MTSSIKKWLGVIAASATVIINVVGVFINANEISDLKRDLQTMSIEYESLKNEVHGKELACEVLKTVANREYSHTYCVDR